MSDDSRGQAEVLGAVLLTGIVITASVITVGVALGSFGSTADQTAEEAIERLLLDIRSASTDVALEGETTRVVPIQLPDGAEMQTSSEPTELRILHHNYDGENSTEILHEVADIGAVSVEYKDVTYSLQGGGLFKHDGHTGSLIAPPNLALRGFTANLPILRLEATETSSLPDSVTVTPGEHIRPAFPDLSTTYEDNVTTYDNPVFNGTIEIAVTGTHYEGWGQFFTQFTDGNISIDHENQTTSAFVESLEELTFDNAVVYSGDFDVQGNAANTDGFEKAAFLPDNTEIVESRLEDLEESSDTAEDCDIHSGTIGDCTLTAGEYYVNGSLELVGDLTIDTDDGDVVLGIDGDLLASGASITVTGDSDNGVEYYLSGLFEFGGGTTVGTDNESVESHRNIFYVAGEGSTDPGDGNMELDAIIYAPNAHLDFSGTPTIRGAIFAGDVSITGNTEITIDPDLIEELEGLDVSQTATPIMYLHITENTASIEF